MANIPIQNLTSASSPINSSAYMIIKDGVQDKKATVSQVREIDISAFSPKASPAVTDLVMIGTGSSTYKATFDQVSFPANTYMWFYQASAPSNWAHVTTLTDCLIGVSGGSTYTTPGSGTNGTWLTADHTLTVSEIPSHNHNINVSKNSLNSFPSISNPRAGKSDVAGLSSTDFEGGGQGHNHGDTWRPKAAIGIIARKIT